MSDRPLPELEGVSHAWVDAGGLRTHLALAGDPANPPLLLVHGWPQHWYMWRAVIAPLAERFRVICPDLRGFGWTDAPGHGYGPRTFAGDLLALLDALEIERTRILAHDWGGLASYYLACWEPERVQRLLTLNIPPPWVRVEPRVVLSLWRFGYQLVMATPGLGTWLVRAMGRPGRVQRVAIGAADWSGGAGASYAAQVDDPARARAIRSLYRHALLREEPRIALRRNRGLRLRTPTRLLWGVADAGLSTALLSGVGDQADELEVVRVPGCGHFIAEERPELVVEHALEFL